MRHGEMAPIRRQGCTLGYRVVPLDYATDRAFLGINNRYRPAVLQGHEFGGFGTGKPRAEFRTILASMPAFPRQRDLADGIETVGLPDVENRLFAIILDGSQQFAIRGIT